MNPIPFTTIDWSTVPKTEHPGKSGTSFWQTIQYPGLRIRIVEYAAGYLADHWCQKGHIVYCLEGEVFNEQQNGEVFVLRKNMSYVVTDDMSSHRSRTHTTVKLLIIDGEFLNSLS
jgi:hypothetical protein